MQLQTIRSDYEQYQAFLVREVRKGCITLSTLGVVLFPAFSVLDYLTQYHEFKTLSVIRFSTTFLFLAINIMFRKGIWMDRPFLTGSFALGIAALSITLMCIVLGGTMSPYYAGINIVLLAGVLFLPSSGGQMTLTIGLVITIYVVGMLFFNEPITSHNESFINNMYFLVSTGIIGVTAAYSADRMRRESFFRYLEIKRSTDVLQSELTSRHDSIEELAQEIVQKKTEASNALKQRDSFISIASHELKTPITALKLQLEVGKMKLRNKALNETEVQKLITSTDTQIQRVIRIVDEMLDVSRIQSGKFDIEKRECDLGLLIETVVTRYFSSALDSEQIQLNITQSVIGHWDPFKIEQVLLNLITNSLRYGEGHPIIIKMAKDDNEAVVSVKDSGVGISPDDRERIFEKFERGSTSQFFGGLGLGLYICKQIIEGHSGKILVESEVGQGAEFIVRLPIE